MSTSFSTFSGSRHFGSTDVPEATVINLRGEPGNTHSTNTGQPEVSEKASAQSALTDLLGALPEIHVSEAGVAIPGRMASAAFAVGRLSEAHSWATLGIERSGEQSSINSSADISTLQRILSGILLEWHDVQRAVHHGTAAVEEMASSAPCEEQVMACLQIAAATAAVGNTAETLAHLDEARRTALTAALNQTVHNCLVREHVSTLLDIGEVTQAEHWLSGLQQHLAADASDEALCLRALVVQNKIDGIGDRAIRLLKSLRSDASLRTRIEVGAAAAVALDASGRRNEASVILSTTIQLGETEGFVHTMARFGKAISPLLQSLRESGPQGRHVWSNAYLDRLIAAASTSQREQGPDELVIDLDRPYEMLSERELQVLRLLSGTLSNREIGAELYLSVNTVKTHVKSVYAKLGVNRRAEAVNRGRKLGLLRNTSTEMIPPQPSH